MNFRSILGPVNLHSPFRVLLMIPLLLLMTAYSAQGQSCLVNETLRVQAPDAGNLADYGWSAAMDGNVAVISAIFANNQSCEAYVYRFDGTAWNLE